MKKELLLIAFLFVSLAFILFGNGIKGQFVYDDNWVIARNPMLGNLADMPSIFISPYHYQNPETGLYRPLTILSLSLNTLASAKPSLFHIVNILLHAINSFLVFFFIFKLFKSKRLAYAVSLLFLALPIHVEDVTSIVGRADLLVFFFSILALLLAYSKKYWFASAAFFLALLSKESAIGLAPIIFLMIVYNEYSSPRLNLGEKRSNLFWRFWPAVKKSFIFFPAGFFYLILRWAALKNDFLSNDATYIFNPLKFTDALTRFYTALKVMFLYLWKSFVPLHLSADYSYNQIPLVKNFFSWPVIFGILLLAGFVFLIFWKKTRETPLGCGSLIFLSSFFITSNFIFPIGTIMAEREFYLPSLGILLIAGYGFDKLMKWRWKNLWTVLLAAVIIFYGALTVNRNHVWLNAAELYSDMVIQSPASAHAKKNLGVLYIQSNLWAEGKDLLNKSYKIAPENISVLDALGIVAEHEKRYQDAEKFYLAALRIKPYYANSMSNLGRMYFQLGKYQASADLYWQAFQNNPRPDQKEDFMLVYAMSMSKAGKSDEAIAAVVKYYGDKPNNTKLQFALGYAYFKKGDRSKADEYFKTSKNPAMSNEEFIKSLENF